MEKNENLHDNREEKEILKENEIFFKDGTIQYTIPNLFSILLIINTQFDKKNDLINKILQFFTKQYPTLLINYDFENTIKDIFNIPEPVIENKNMLLFPQKDFNETLIPISQNFFYSTFPLTIEAFEKFHQFLYLHIL